MKKSQIISIANQKGGVGKTTTALNLGAALSQKGKRVLLIDLDHQANLSCCLGYENNQTDTTITNLFVEVLNEKITEEVIEKAIQTNETEKIDYIPSDKKLTAIEKELGTTLFGERQLKILLEQEILKKYEYIIIDCTPNLGMLLINALSCSDEVIIPTQTQKLSMDGLEELLLTIKKVKNNINEKLKVKKIVLTMVENTKISKMIEEVLREAYGELVAKQIISRRVEVQYSMVNGTSSIINRNSHIGEQYLKLVEEMMEV